MASFNKVILIGNLTRDPEVKYSSKGMAVGKISLAMNRKWKSESGEMKEEVTFVECDAFGKTAETIAQYVKKGQPFMVSGRLKMDSWEDKQSGQKRSRLGVVIEEFQFLGGKSDGEARPAAREKPAESNAAPKDPEDDEAPF